jgi:hypothetical protein
MFTPLGWGKRVSLAVVALTAISPNIAVSVATSIVLLAFGVWDHRQERRRPAVPVRDVTVEVGPPTGPAPPTVFE